MNKRLRILGLVIGLSLILSAGLGSRNTYACECGCSMVCDNRCQFACSGCSLSEAIESSMECCDGAHAATGDTGPCAVMSAS